MSSDPPPSPAEQEALDRPWRVSASVAIGTFVLVSIVLGFVIVPQSAEPGLNPFAAMCRAIGIPGFDRSDAPRAPPATPAAQASDVTWTPNTRHLFANADIQQGSVIAAGLCSGCHGKDGIGLVPTYPNLTHQSAAAVFKQLRDYKTGARQGGLAAVMVPIAGTLDDQQMANVAAYYASLAPRVVKYGSDTPPQILELVQTGSPARALPPCEACHGGNMSGPAESPVLLGQSVTYFEEQMNAFAAGKRRNDTYRPMNIIARALTPEEIRQLAVYYGEQPGR
jgi:cytochrome c553